jgi:hypothetical protein
MTERKVDLETHKIDYPEWGELGEHMPKMAVGKYYKQQGLKK